MSDKKAYPGSSLESLRHRLQGALAKNTDPRLDIELRGCLDTVADMEGAPTHSIPISDTASVEHTFLDEAYRPHGREFDVRIYYSSQEGAAGEVHLEDIEILAVRYFDATGNELAADAHLEELAWAMVGENEDYLIDLCSTKAAGSGTSPGEEQGEPVAFVPRLAPSVPTRPARQGRLFG